MTVAELRFVLASLPDAAADAEVVIRSYGFAAAIGAIDLDTTKTADYRAGLLVIRAGTIPSEYTIYPPQSEGERDG